MRAGQSRSVIFTAGNGRYFGFWVVIFFFSCSGDRACPELVEGTIASLVFSHPEPSSVVAAAVPSGGAFLVLIQDNDVRLI